MKTKLAIIKSLAEYLRLGAAAGAVLLSCGLPFHARAAAFDSPVGIWDVTFSGSRQGLALIEFNVDNTFSVFEIVVPKKPSSSGDNGRGAPESRNPGGDASRNPFVSTAGSSTVNPEAAGTTNLFGQEFVTNGQWHFDTSGNLIGFYGESLGQICTTTTVTITNCINGDIPGQPCGFVTNIVTTNCVSINAGVNFKGKVTPGKRLTLMCQAFSRPFTASGVPVDNTLTNIAGNYYGTRIRGGLSSIEFLTLSPVTPPVEMPDMANVYSIVGGSSDYTYNIPPGGFALLSRSGKIAFTMFFDDFQTVRATVGGFDRRRLRFNTQGVEQPGGDLKDFIRFNGAFSPAVP